MQGTDQLTVTFDFKNSTGKTITINSVHASCGCMEVRIISLVYKDNTAMPSKEFPAQLHTAVLLILLFNMYYGIKTIGNLLGMNLQHLSVVSAKETIMAGLLLVGSTLIGKGLLMGAYLLLGTLILELSFYLLWPEPLEWHKTVRICSLII